MMLSVAGIERERERERERESPYFCDRLPVEPTKISVCGRKAERGGDGAMGARGSNGDGTRGNETESDGARGNESERQSKSESESETESETESGRE